MRYKVDKIYVSCIYDWNINKCNEWNGKAEIGGTGYNIQKQLPPEIENVKPRINLGFTTRGCIRNCPFCVVPKKEGKIRIVGDLLDLWDGKEKEVIILDNNILAVPRHFELICKQAKENKIRVDFNQGLDIRLLTKDIAKLLRLISHYEYRFAFDNMEDESAVEQGIKTLKEVGINRSSFYVLVGFNTTPEQDLYRLNFLRNRKQNAYVQRYNYKSGDKFYIALARWANQRHIFQGMTWKQFLSHPENKRYAQSLSKWLRKN